MRPYLYPYTCITGPTLRVLQEHYLQVQQSLKKRESYRFGANLLKNENIEMDATQSFENETLQREVYCYPNLGGFDQWNLANQPRKGVAT